MKLISRCFSLALLLTAMATTVGQAEVLTLTDGQTLFVEELRYEADKAVFRVGTESRTLAREAIRDVGFAGQKTEAQVLSTDSLDLQEMMNKATAMLEKYPDSTSILVQDEGDFTVRNDGTRLTRVRTTVLMAKEESLGNAEVSLYFEPSREKVRVLYARSFNPDGTVSSLSPDQIRITKGSSGGVSFDQYQQLSFTIPGAKVGSLIDYSYESEEFNPFDKNLFQGFFFFKGSDPVVNTVLRVRTPKDKPLYFVTPNMTPEKAKPREFEENGMRVYEWQDQQVGPVIPEPSMPPMRDVLPGVAYCLQKDWTYLVNRLKPMFEKRFQLTDAVKKKVDEILIGAKTLEEKIGRLYLFCQKEIRYISIKGNLSSNQVGHAAEETLKNRYGDCTDKGMLLATMLKHIGVEAYPIGIRTNNAGKAIRELPIFDSNHCITEVILNGKKTFLDSTATDYRFPYFRADDHDTLAENTMTGTLDQIPLPPPEDNAVRNTRELTLTKDGSLKIDFFSVQNGTAEAGSREGVRSMKPEEYEKQVRAAVSGLSADYTLDIATFTNPLDFTIPFTAHSGYTLNRYVPRSGKYLILEIPYYRMRFSEVSLAERTYPIQYMTSSLRSDDITINLPDGVRVKYLPPNVDWKTPYIEYSAKYESTGKTVKISRRFANLKREVPVKDYASHKETLEKISRSTEERMVLEDTSEKGGKK